MVSVICVAILICIRLSPFHLAFGKRHASSIIISKCID